ALHNGREANGVPKKPEKPAVEEARKPPPPGPDPSVVGGDAQLTPIEGELPYLNDRTRAEFRRQWDAVKMYDHPYVVYLNMWAARLPASAPKCPTRKEVPPGLRGLLAHLRPGQDIEALSERQLCEAIDQVLNYDAWRAQAGRRVYSDANKPLE